VWRRGDTPPQPLAGPTLTGYRASAVQIPAGVPPGGPAKLGGTAPGLRPGMDGSAPGVRHLPAEPPSALGLKQTPPKGEALAPYGVAPGQGVAELAAGGANEPGGPSPLFPADSAGSSPKAEATSPGVPGDLMDLFKDVAAGETELHRLAVSLEEVDIHDLSLTCQGVKTQLRQRFPSR